ncbi:hypothetical protein GCM10010404_81150 [Nonomuraea africana]|uniref:Uncharacterized protein n=1 Tax=Nonomuraea africana TaxID=46171 RepID=A0ABR9KWW3_9ACTN|nr:hypothetical protein [Nonomuraea africana]MBE1566507.1 hypothetical protein [Nonomuraea africana]
MHAISSTWDEPLPKGATMGELMEGRFRSYSCFCGQPLLDRSAAQLHAIETNQCSICLGQTRISLVPGTEHGCGYCNVTGTRDAELAEQLDRGKVEAVIDEAAFLRVVEGFRGEAFTQPDIVERLAAMAPEVLTPQLMLRVGQLLRVVERKGVIMRVSAPSGVDGVVVLYDTPRYQVTSSGTRPA